MKGKRDAIELQRNRLTRRGRVLRVMVCSGGRASLEHLASSSAFLFWLWVNSSTSSTSSGWARTSVLVMLPVLSRASISGGKPYCTKILIFSSASPEKALSLGGKHEGYLVAGVGVEIDMDVVLNVVGRAHARRGACRRFDCCARLTRCVRIEELMVPSP